MSFYLSATGPSAALCSANQLFDLGFKRLFPKPDTIQAYFLAFTKGDLSKVDQLISEGLSPNVVDSEGNNAFHHLAGRIEMLNSKKQLAFGASLSACAKKAESLGVKKNLKNKEGMTPLELTEHFEDSKKELITVLNKVD